MLRIGQFTDTFIPVVDGVGRVALSYAQTLARAGHQVTVFAPMNDTGHRGGYPFELVEYASFRVPTQPQYKTGAAAFDSHYRRRLSMIELDILHTHSPFESGREALRIAKERDLPVVASFHSKYYDDFYKATKSESLSKLLLANIIAFYHKCDDVWAVSESTAEVLRTYGYRRQIHIVPNGVTMRDAKPEAVRELERAYGLAGLPLLLFVGQINWKKNILRVLESAALLRRSGRAFKLLLAGQGPDEREIGIKIGELDIGDTASLIGHVGDIDRLDALYARASLFVFPSLYDNAPMVVREAAVMATPSVLAEGSSAADVIVNGKNGFLCRNDSAHLRDVIAWALDHPEETKTVGLAARSSIPVPWETVIAEVVTRYQYLIDRSKSPLSMGKGRRFGASGKTAKKKRG